MTLHDTATVQTDTAGPTPIAGSRRYRLRSEPLDQTFTIDVALPMIPPRPGERLPVVYVTDGDSIFGITSQIARMLQSGPFPLRPVLVVGIGYASQPGDMAAMHLRVRDLTPWVDAAHEARFRNAPPPWTLPPEIRQGGAKAFGAFIEEELKPFIASLHEVDADDQTLVGMSLGGLFTLHSLFTAPERFRRYVALSPSLYWDQRRVFEIEAALAASAKDLPVSLFLGVGGLEEGHDLDCRMVSNLYELEARLRARNYPGLDLGFQVFTDETHMSVFAGAVTRGLVSVFGGHGDVRDWAKVLET